MVASRMLGGEDVRAISKAHLYISNAVSGIFL